MSLRVGIVTGLFLLWCASAYAAPCSVSYRARVIHNNRSALSLVSGSIDAASGDYIESVDKSYRLDFKQMPAQLADAHPELPALWGADGRTAQRWGNGLPRYDSPLLRHFIVGSVILAPEKIRPKSSHLSGQLEVETVKVDAASFQVVARLRGGALVITGNRQRIGEFLVPRDIAVLGPGGELYQYLFDEVNVGEPLTIALPGFDPSQYVAFPAGESLPVPTRPIKDWLVFQAELPNGRPLNLLFDSGADTMIVDDMVLRLDAGLEPVGETLVDSGIGSGTMKLYDGFSFNVGGVEFRNLPVLGGTLTSVTMGGGLRIHGIVGGEILQLCQLDLDLANGTLRLRQSDAPEPGGAQKVALTFIQQLPHIEAQVEDKDAALLLLDTGQRSGLSLNLDYLSHHKLDGSLVMDGFLGGIKGGLLPRYMLEEVDVSLAGQNYKEKTVDATPVSTFAYEGIPVAGAIGFSLLARHFGGMTFDYRRRALYLRDPGQELKFTGQPEAWGGAALARANIGEEAPENGKSGSLPASALKGKSMTASQVSEAGEQSMSAPAVDFPRPSTQFNPLPPDPPTASQRKPAPSFRINRKLSARRTAMAISSHQFYVQIPKQD